MAAPAPQPAARRASISQSLIALIPAALIVAVIVFVVSGISARLDRLGAAASDTMAEQLTQLDFDHRVMLRTVETAQTEADLDGVREGFDALQSRLVLVRNGRSFAALRDDPEVAAALDALGRSVDGMAPVVDGPDAALLRALPGLRDTLGGTRADLRQVVQAGSALFANGTDAGRISASETLRRLGLLTIALLGLLLALSTYMWQLYRVSREHAAAAERSAARMAAVVETAPDGVVITDEAGIVQDFNGAAERMFGCARGDVIGHPMRDAILSDLPPAIAPTDTPEDTPPSSGEGVATMVGACASGEIFPLEVSVATSRDPDGLEMRVYFTRDITARTDAERDLRAARDAALAGERAKQRLLSVMGHEMRTPLNGILATVELLQATRLDDKQTSYVTAIAESGNLLLHHVDDVLDVSRLDSGSAITPGRPIDIGSIVHEIVAEHQDRAARNGTAITVNLPARTTVTGDPIALRRVLGNLVENSAKFTTNGVIDISIDRLGADDMVEFCIADTGVGIDPGDQARIFDDFITLDASHSRTASGAGLGLGVVQRLVRQMGGDIGLESEPGEGSLFWVRVPLPPRDTSDTATATPGPAIRPHGRPLDVLVVEDNDINRLVVREMLQAAGHDVTEAADGAAGIEAAETRRFDLILMDISMPRVDGVEATRRIRSGNGPCRDTPIVALTANALLHEVSIFRDAGMNETITKPISRRTLDRALVLAQELQPAPRAAATAAAVQTEKAATAGSSAEATLGPLADTRLRHAEPEVDHDQLDALRSEIGRQRADALLVRFMDDADRTIAALLRQGPDDIDAMLAEIHKLAGSAAMFGAARLHARLRDFDAMGKTGHGDAVPARVPELQAIWAQTRPALKEASESASDPART